MKAEEFTSKRLAFIPLNSSFASTEYVKWMNNNEVNRYLDSGGDYTMNKLKEFLVDVERKSILFWAIVIKNNKHIGNIKIDPINYDSNSGEFGIMIGDENEWGKGYAKEASIRVIEYCFKTLKLSSITLGVIQDNIKAFNLYNNLGFSVTDINKNSGIYNNKPCNSLRMILYAENFKQ